MEKVGRDTKSSPRTFLVLSLFASYFATGPLALLVSLFLIEIGDTFKVPVGIMGQINTPYSIVAFAFALFMGVLSVRFKHRSLLLIGLLLFSISALGCLLSQDFTMMLMSYSLSGVGWALISPMCITLIGEHLSMEKRASAIGWTVAGGALAYITAPVIALIGRSTGWRFTLLGFVIPVILAAFLLAFFGLPSSSPDQNPEVKRKVYVESFREVLTNRSAVSCLLGDALRSASFVAILIYGASFFRQRFTVSSDYASIWILAAALSYTVGSLFCGPIVNRFGRKSSTVVNAFFAGIFMISYVCATNLWFSIALSFISSWFFGAVASTANSLALEQVSKFQSTMMSLDSAIINLGSALGTAAGGFALLFLDFQGLGIVLGVFGIVSALVFLLLTTDPTRKKTMSSAHKRMIENSER